MSAGALKCLEIKGSNGGHTPRSSVCPVNCLWTPPGRGLLPHKKEKNMVPASHYGAFVHQRPQPKPIKRGALSNMHSLQVLLSGCGGTECSAGKRRAGESSPAPLTSDRISSHKSRPGLAYERLAARCAHAAGVNRKRLKFAAGTQHCENLTQNQEIEASSGNLGQGMVSVSQSRGTVLLLCAPCSDSPYAMDVMERLARVRHPPVPNPSCSRALPNSKKKRKWVTKEPFIFYCSFPVPKHPPVFLADCRRVLSQHKTRMRCVTMCPHQYIRVVKPTEFGLIKSRER